MQKNLKVEALRSPCSNCDHQHEILLTSLVSCNDIKPSHALLIQRHTATRTHNFIQGKRLIHTSTNNKRHTKQKTQKTNTTNHAKRIHTALLSSANHASPTKRLSDTCTQLATLKTQKTVTSQSLHSKSTNDSHNGKTTKKQTTNTTGNTR